MVEGHSVHRIATQHTRRLCGRSYKASSPNGRFAEGARLINGRSFSRIEAVGKNLFAFFAAAGQPDVVMHVHFGMSGRWSVEDAAKAAPAKDTTRLQLEGHGIVSSLSAMTVQHGGVEMFEKKRAELGEDPIRADADAEALWERVSRSKKTIGLLLMDQGFFAGVGNIYRAEILFVASVHPNTPGKALSRAEFDRVWAASVKLMRRGYEEGSILTVDKAEALALGRPGLRRWIYNSAKCGRCNGRVASWDVAGRTCYACAACQPLDPSESLEARLAQPAKLRVAELREALTAAGLDAGGKKAELAAAGESRAVEHVAEWEVGLDGAASGRISAGFLPVFHKFFIFCTLLLCIKIIQGRLLQASSGPGGLAGAEA
ncbi:putative formamidopyrimidine-DNA glycosylase [Emiliania huxleyi CCMP1516]|uniref:DNA-(apurinic or apyrimidinic site) lyase n=2 Tax=Emiliania huxleyi TaxID=2903 RepID=A0A0D3J9R5_EMIH1|nr:putative formamidopyrimidine-DNA glycosylase [Emiliania huxleyi CCMP1516]EOD20250.1 putative formamidopyrimidine-DNA glycosylase [Emiliania huxleyi CCMP1516]|eukprot:XP_005772679.1 putative formamidopyrimidine-DNA glycosylase [Emiliania huxleyi CCMP1516]